MGNTSDFFVDFIIAQNLEKVKFWEGRKKGRKEGSERRKGEERGAKQKMGHVGKGGGVAVWRFQFLPFARKAAPVFACQYLAIKKVVHKAIFFEKRLDNLPRLRYNITVNNEPHDLPT